MSKIDVSLLIDEVKKHRELYDKSLDVYRDEKILCWKQIGAVIFSDWDTYNKAEEYNKVLELQRKWRSIRDQMNRELRLRKVSNQRRKVYRYFKKLKFMLKDEDLEQAGGDNSIDEYSHDPDESNEITQEFSTSISENYNTDALPAKQRRYKSKSLKKNTSPIPSPITEIANYPPDEDSDRLFLLSFVEEMSKLPSNIKMWARAEIARVMQEAVNRNYDNTLGLGQIEDEHNLLVKRQRVSHDELIM